MDNPNEKEANEIYINFNNENYEFGHDYTKPFSRGKSIVEKNSFLKNESLQTDTDRSKKTNKSQENVYPDKIKKEFDNLIEEFNYHQSHFTNNTLNMDVIEQSEFVSLFSFVERQNNLLKEIWPLLSSNPESNKSSSLDDKLKNNFINKIYDLETKLSEKDNIISQLTSEINSLKSKYLQNTNNNASNDLQNSESQSEQIYDSLNSPPKSPYNGFVNIARNSIYSNNKFPFTAKTPSIKLSEASIKDYQNSKNNLNIVSNSSQFNFVKKFEVESADENANNCNNNSNKKPEFYQRKKNNVIKEEQRSRSFCLANESNNQSLNGLDCNFSLLNEKEKNGGDNEANNQSENENKESKIQYAEEPEFNRCSVEEDKLQELTESKNNNDVPEKPRKSIAKTRGRNISLPDFNSLHHPKQINENHHDDDNLKDNDNNIEIELRNNSFTDVADNVNIENPINSNDNVASAPNNNSKIASSFENEIISKKKKQAMKFNKTNSLRDQEILIKIKDSFLSLSSYDNSLNSSLNNISHISNKSGNNNNNCERDNKRLKRNKSLFDDRNKISSEVDGEKIENYAKRKTQNFSYLNLLINNKNLQQSKREGNLIYDSDKENSDFYNDQSQKDDRIKSDKTNNCKELNMNLINETLKINSNDANLISNSPLHHNIDAINNQLSSFNYKSFKDENNAKTFNNKNDTENSAQGLKFDKTKGTYEKQTHNKTKNKSNSVVIKNRRNRDYKNYFNNMNENNYDISRKKIDKKFAEDKYLINSEQELCTEPIDYGNFNEKFYLEKLAFDINLDNLTKARNETSKNKKISGRFLKETLFKNDFIDDQLVNLNSDETQGNDQKENRTKEVRIAEQKENLNFSFNNSKNDIKVKDNDDDIISNSVSANKEDAQEKLLLKDSVGGKKVKKISVVRNDKNIAFKRPLNEKKIEGIKSSENKKAEVIKTTEESNKQNAKEIKFHNNYLNKKLQKESSSIVNSKPRNSKESLEQPNLNSCIITKSKEYSKNLKTPNDKNIKKPKNKNTHESKANLENNQSVNAIVKNNNNKSKVSSVKMRKNYVEPLSHNRSNLLNKQNKKVDSDSNIDNNKKNKDKSTNKLNETINKNFIENLNSEKAGRSLLGNSPLTLENNSLKSLSKKAKFSKSTCDLKNEIYLNINKDGVFSLKPDEGLNLSENEYLSNKESSKNENYKESSENVFSLENEKTPDKKPKILIKESSINKINENTSYDADIGAFANYSNKFTLSHRDLLLANNIDKITDDHQNDNQNYFERLGNENKRLTSRSKSFVQFENININDNSLNEAGLKNTKNSKTAATNKIQKNEHLISKVNKSNQNKIETVPPNLIKNATKSKLETSFNDLTKVHNQTQSSISFNFINNISINAPGNSNFVIENNEKPATYTKKLLAKYYKYVDDYNRKINNESSKTNKNQKLNDSKTSKSTNKK